MYSQAAYYGASNAGSGGGGRSYGQYQMTDAQPYSDVGGRRQAQQQQQQQQQQGPFLNGITPPPSGGANEAQSPLDKKIMVLYVKPGDPVSMQAWQMVADYPEILVQDASQIQPRPPWLTGVPTVVQISDRRVFAGPEAFRTLSVYINNLKVASGAQSSMVVPTVDNNKGFAVADKSVHYLAAADERRVAEVPVGQGNHHAMSVGQINFATEEDMRYYQSGKVSEQEVSSYAALRTQQRSRPVQWKPSVLEDGTMVTM